MTEDDTFEALRRTQFDYLLPLRVGKSFPEWLEVLHSNGWTFEEWRAEYNTRYQHG